MIKKIGLLFLSIFVIFGFGVSFANPIAPQRYCYTLKNVKVDNYRVIIERGKRNSDLSSAYNIALLGNSENREVYEPEARKCTKCSFWGMSKVYLLDKNINIDDITQENIDDSAIFVGNIRDSDCTSYYDHTITYNITKDGDGYTLENKMKDWGKLKQFPLFLISAIMIETLVLFFIAKLFRKEGQITNKRLIFLGTIPTIITLPLLWFILPSILGDGILYIVTGEFLVVVLETVMIKYGLNISWGKSAMASIMCNILSFCILSASALIKEYYDSHSMIIHTPILIRIYRPLLYILIEFITICIVGKMRSNGNLIQNKRVILTGILAPIVSVLTLILLLEFIVNVIDIWYDGLIILAFLISLFIEIFLIKYLFEFSWKKATTTSIICKLFFIIIYLA